MRVARSVQVGQGQASLSLYGPNNIFVRKLASNATLAADQTPAMLLANQCNYGNVNYSWTANNPNLSLLGYNGGQLTAPAFYGYPSSGPAAGNANMGYGGWSVETSVNFSQFTQAMYVVNGSVPTQAVTYVQSDGMTPQPNGAHNNLQSFFNAVPVPDVTKIPQGQIWPNGTDQLVVVWRPSTNEMWEMWRLNGSPGAYTFQYGGYISSVSTFNGIFPVQSQGSWGASASGLAIMGGTITIQDVVDVLNGLPIRHAIGISVEVTSPVNSFHVPPATRCDSPPSSHVPQFQVDGVTANPAYSTANTYGNGYVDAVPEGSWFRFPASFNPASAMPGAGPLALAIATAIRDYGLELHDRSGSVSLQMEDPRVLGSPYSYAKVNPFAGSTGAAAGYYDSYINNNVPGNWTNPSLPKITEVLSGASSVLAQLPWQQLQVLQPFSS